MGTLDREEAVVTRVEMLQGAPGEDPQRVSVPIVPDGTEGNRVFVRPARPGESSEGVRLSEGEQLVVRLEASHVAVNDEPELIRVVPDGREGNTVFVRRLRPDELDTNETVSWIPDEQQLVITTHISHAGIHMTSEVGRTDDLLTAVRLVPDGREGSIVHAHPSTGRGRFRGNRTGPAG